jgi:hypothetical protein
MSVLSLYVDEIVHLLTLPPLYVPLEDVNPVVALYRVQLPVPERLVTQLTLSAR